MIIIIIIIIKPSGAKLNCNPAEATGRLHGMQVHAIDQVNHAGQCHAEASRSTQGTQHLPPQQTPAGVCTNDPASQSSAEQILGRRGQPSSHTPPPVLFPTAAIHHTASPIPIRFRILVSYVQPRMFMNIRKGFMYKE